jgi:23S rRNA (uracil1939-C5)-methyltransferase
MNKIIHYLTIEKIAMHGYGLGFADGKAVFVPYTMPGDCVNALVRLEKKDVIFATVDEYIHTSDLSIMPACDAFGGDNACGGCDWLMAPYRTQVHWKTELIKQTFEPLRLKSKVTNTVASPQPKFYRNKSFLPAAMAESGLVFGMFERYSHRVVPHKHCQLQPPVMDEILAAIVTFANTVKLEAYNEKTQKGILRHVGIRINQKQDQILLILVTKSAKFPFTNQFVRTLTQSFPQITGIIQNINRSVGNVILGEEDKLLYGSYYLDDNLDELKYRLHYKSFFQVNSQTTAKLYIYLKSCLGKDETVLDAYCGIGSIALFVAGIVQRVYGIEESPEAIKDALHNQALNGITNAEFVTGLVEELLPQLVTQHSFSTIILDPPRKGVETTALLALAEHKIPQILYVSCNPMTLARDVKILTDNGYKVDEIVPFDMFPQTWHIETVARLSLTQDK